MGSPCDAQTPLRLPLAEHPFGTNSQNLGGEQEGGWGLPVMQAPPKQKGKSGAFRVAAGHPQAEFFAGGLAGVDGGDDLAAEHHGDTI